MKKNTFLSGMTAFMEHIIKTSSRQIWLLSLCWVIMSMTF